MTPKEDDDRQTQRPTTIERGVPNRIDSVAPQLSTVVMLRPSAPRREDQARADGGAVDDHRAGAAYAVLAADMRAGEQEIVTQKVAHQQAQNPTLRR